MPFYNSDTVNALVGRQTDGDITLDLRGLSLAEAKSSLEAGLCELGSEGVKSIVVLIDPASPSSGETLFLPIGRQLLEARARGLVCAMHPLPQADGGGFYVELNQEKTS